MRKDNNLEAADYGICIIFNETLPNTYVP